MAMCLMFRACRRRHATQLLKAAVEGTRVDALKDTLEGVMGRNTIGQCEETLQPSMALFAKRVDLLPIIGATQDGTKGDNDDVEQLMSFVAVDARVFELAEMVFDGKRGSQGNSSMKRDVKSATNRRRCSLDKNNARAKNSGRV